MVFERVSKKMKKADQEWEEIVSGLLKEPNNWKWAGFYNIEQIECNKYDEFEITVHKSYYRSCPDGYSLFIRLFGYREPCSINVFYVNKKYPFNKELVLCKEYNFNDKMYYQITSMHDKIKSQHKNKLYKEHEKESRKYLELFKTKA